jgi:hypothetical protein
LLFLGEMWLWWKTVTNVPVSPARWQTAGPESSGECLKHRNERLDR